MSEQPVVAGAISSASLPYVSERGVSHCPGTIWELAQPREQPHAGGLPSITRFWTLRGCSSRHWLSCAGWPQCWAVFLDACERRWSSQVLVQSLILRLFVRSHFLLPTLLLEEEKQTQREHAAAQGAFGFTCLAFHLQV